MLYYVFAVVWETASGRAIGRHSTRATFVSTVLTTAVRRQHEGVAQFLCVVKRRSERCKLQKYILEVSAFFSGLIPWRASTLGANAFNRFDY